MQRSLIHTLAMFMDEIRCKAPLQNFNFTNSFLHSLGVKAPNLKTAQKLGGERGAHGIE